MKDPIIRAVDVKYAYEGDGSINFALNGVSFQVREGAFVGILGHNGSGKSTLAKQLNALMKPRAGKVYIGGLDTEDDDNLYAIREMAGMVFQNPDNQLVATVVEEDVAFGPENLGLEPAEIRRRVDDALAAVRMTGTERRSPHMLSGGQKQRIAIAGVLALSPEIIIFDEPTAMLDPQGRDEVLESIKRLNREEGKTVVYITHFLDEVAEADELIVMHDGFIAAKGVPREIFADRDTLERASLAQPFAAEIFTLLGTEAFPDGAACPTNTEELVDLLCRAL